MPGGVGVFVQGGVVKPPRVGEAVPWRKMDLVLSRRIVGAVALVVDDGDAAVRQDVLRPLVRIPNKAFLPLLRRDAVDLGGVEDMGNDDLRLFQLHFDLDRIALGVEFGLAGDGVELGDALRKHPVLHRRPVFAPPDLVSGLSRLVVGQPAIVVPILEHEHERVDATVVFSGGGVDRHDGPAGDPRLLPGRGPGLDLLDKRVRHLAVKRLSGLYRHGFLLNMAFEPPNAMLVN